MYFTKKNIEKKHDLQESYNNFRIELKIYLCESKGSWFFTIGANMLTN